MNTLPFQNSLHDTKTNYVLVTLTHIRGSAPQIVGAKIIVTDEGLQAGTIGGGKIEAHAIQFAKNLLQNKASSQLQTWNLQKDIGMSCGGEVSLFFDVHTFTQWNIAIFGAGHISQELCRVISTWSAQVNVYDPRREWIEKLPTAKNITTHTCQDLAAQVAHLPANSYVTCMTMGHATDLPILKEALTRDFPFVGCIGSAIKSQKLRMELREHQIPDLKIEKLICPLGLKIGNNTPPEIAISIAAQLLQEKPQHD